MLVPHPQRCARGAKPRSAPLPLALTLIGALASCAARPEADPFRLVGAEHFVDGISALADNGRTNVVIEIPTGTLAKWEVNKDDGSLAWEFEGDVPRVVGYLGYPGNYGMVPQTFLPKDMGGDGDPVDVLVLGTALDRGKVVEARLIGVMEMLDGGEQDDKLIAVIDGTPFERVGSIAELDDRFPGVTSIVSTWFANYKRETAVEVLGFEGPGRAAEVLAAAMAAYSAARDAQTPEGPGN